MILVGKSGGSPKHGCPFCSAGSPYHQNGNLYTIADLLQWNKVGVYIIIQIWVKFTYY